MKKLLLASALLFCPDVAEACAPAPPHGQDVTIAGEEAVIAWDAATKTEHFVRRAQFESSAKDFGFLVPTPTKPTLAEADANVFQRLHDKTKPEIQTRTELEPSFSCLSLFMLKASRDAATSAAPEQAAVRVLGVEHVSGYEAAILQADDAEALRKWLDEHGYEARPALTSWLAAYVANKWIITAFKIVDKSGSHQPASSAVRMTFKTERPFYPYREPSDQPKTTYPLRTLRVFLVTSQRQQGGIGAEARPWAGELRYARSTPGLGALLAGAVPDVPDTAWLHDFVDPSTPRPGIDDLFFAPASAQAEVIPPPIIHVNREKIPIPLDLIAIVGIGAFLVVRVSRRRS